MTEEKQLLGLYEKVLDELELEQDNIKHLDFDIFCKHILFKTIKADDHKIELKNNNIKIKDALSLIKNKKVFGRNNLEIYKTHEALELILWTEKECSFTERFKPMSATLYIMDDPKDLYYEQQWFMIHFLKNWDAIFEMARPTPDTKYQEFNDVCKIEYSVPDLNCRLDMLFDDAGIVIEYYEDRPHKDEICMQLDNERKEILETIAQFKVLEFRKGENLTEFIINKFVKNYHQYLNVVEDDITFDYFVNNIEKEKENKEFMERIDKVGFARSFINKKKDYNDICRLLYGLGIVDDKRLEVKLVNERIFGNREKNNMQLQLVTDNIYIDINDIKPILKLGNNKIREKGRNDLDEGTNNRNIQHTLVTEQTIIINLFNLGLFMIKIIRNMLSNKRIAERETRKDAITKLEILNSFVKKQVHKNVLKCNTQINEKTKLLESKYSLALSQLNENDKTDLDINDFEDGTPVFQNNICNKFVYTKNGEITLNDLKVVYQFIKSDLSYVKTKQLTYTKFIDKISTGIQQYKKKYSIPKNYSQINFIKLLT